MAIDLKTAITSLRGLPYVNADGSPMTIRDALLEQLGGHRPRSGAEAVKAIALGQRILSAGAELELSAEERRLVREAFDQPLLPAAVVAQALQALEA